MTLFDRLLASIKKIGSTLPSTSAHDTDKLEGLTPKEITGVLTPASVGLELIPNSPPQLNYVGNFNVYQPLTPKAAEELTQAAISEGLVAQSNDLLVLDKTLTPPVRKASFLGAVGFCYGNTELSATTAIASYPYVYEVLSKTLYKQLSGTTYEAQTEAVRKTVLQPNQWYHNFATNRLFYAENIDSIVAF